MGQLQRVKVSFLTLSQFFPIMSIEINCFNHETNPTNGMINYNNVGTVSMRPVGTVATYTCDTGYTLNGNTTRTCGSDGMWSGSAPTCQGKWNKVCKLFIC